MLKRDRTLWIVILTAGGGLALSLVMYSFAVGIQHPVNPVAASLRGGQPAIVVTLCNGEGLESVELVGVDDEGDRARFWRIEASGSPVFDDTVIIGDELPGFTTAVPLDEAAMTREVTVIVETSNGITLTDPVDFNVVDDDRLYVDLQPMSQERFRDERHCRGSGYAD